jgi:hypothetical protein
MTQTHYYNANITAEQAMLLREQWQNELEILEVRRSELETLLGLCTEMDEHPKKERRKVTFKKLSKIPRGQLEGVVLQVVQAGKKPLTSIEVTEGVLHSEGVQRLMKKTVVKRNAPISACLGKMYQAGKVDRTKNDEGVFIYSANLLTDKKHEHGNSF